MKALPRVVCLDGEAGWVKEIMIDPFNGQPTLLVIQLMGERDAEVKISTSLVIDLEEDEIRLNIPLEALEVFSGAPTVKPL